MGAPEPLAGTERAAFAHTDGSGRLLLSRTLTRRSGPLRTASNNRRIYDRLPRSRAVDGADHCSRLANLHVNTPPLGLRDLADREAQAVPLALSAVYALEVTLSSSSTVRTDSERHNLAPVLDRTGLDACYALLMLDASPHLRSSYPPTHPASHSLQPACRVLRPSPAVHQHVGLPANDIHVLSDIARNNDARTRAARSPAVSARRAAHRVVAVRSARARP